MKNIEIFKYWWKTSGHWVTHNRAHAVDCWCTRGIIDLPDPPKNARELLKDWVSQ
jgi:hypothetical protein